MRVHHLAFRTDDLDRLTRFYADALGLAILRTAPRRSVWLDAGGTILMLEARSPSEPAIDPRTMELVCFALAADAHAAFAARLERAGVRVEDRTPSTLYFRDPDGRRIGASAYPNQLA